MRGSQDAVEAFHTKFGFPVRRNVLRDTDPEVTALLKDKHQSLYIMAQVILEPAIERSRKNDHRLYRAHLIAEEAGEVLEALAKRDEVKLADALGDLLYVLLGTAVTYDIPLEEVFDEIHRSNLTKTRDAKNDPRMKKGKLKASYSPPDIPKAIEEGRKRDESVSDS